MGITTAVALQAGGVGKTTVTYNIGAILASRGRRVLIVDADGQCNLTDACGFEVDPAVPPYDPQKTIYQVMLQGLLHGSDTESIVLPTSNTILPVPARENLFLLPGARIMARFDIAIATLDDRELLLRARLQDVKDQFDFVLIDCPPGLGMVLSNALFAADEVLIPVETTRRRVHALPVFLKVLARVKQKSPNLKIAGIIPNKYDGRNGHDTQALQYIERFAAKTNFSLFDPISRTTRMNDADDKHLPLLDYEQGLKGSLSPAAVALEALADAMDAKRAVASAGAN